MPIEIRNPADPDGIVATCDGASTSASDCHIVHQEAFLPALPVIAYDTVTRPRVSQRTNFRLPPSRTEQAGASWPNGSSAIRFHTTERSASRRADV